MRGRMECPKGKEHGWAPHFWVPLGCALLLVLASVHAQDSLLAGQSSGMRDEKAVNGVPSIEVAVIKPHDPNSRYNNFRFTRDRFSLDNQPISKLIEFAYAINQEQIIDAPAWIRESYFDIDGKTNAETDPTVPQQQRMVQQLLADRFGLRLHRDKRQLSVYALQVTKGGPRLAPAANADAQPLERSNGHGYETTKAFTNSAISDFVLVMQFFVDRPLVDQTALKGRYDFNLTYSYGDSPSPDPDAAPALFTAIEEQLGLKFQPVKAMTDVFVVDHVEQPSAN